MLLNSASSTLALVSLLLLTTLIHSLNLAEALSAREDSDDYREWQEFKEFQEFRAWKKAMRETKRKAMEADSYKWLNRKDYGFDNEIKFERKRHYGSDNKWIKKGKGISNRDPPPVDQAALMARYIVNQAEWTSVATISSQKGTKSYPFVNIISFSDGPLGNGTGIPYMYLTPLDYTAQDVYKDNRATLMMTLAQGRYCETKNYDPMDPRCARVLLTGKITPVKEDNPEYPIAQNSVFVRHPWLAHMPADHQFFFAKLNMDTIAVLDYFGGPKYVTLEDYMHPSTTNTYIDYIARYFTEEKSKDIQQPVISISF